MTSLASKDLNGGCLHALGKHMDIAEHSNARVSLATPAGHLNHKAGARVLLEVASVDGERRQSEDRVTCMWRSRIGCKREAVLAAKDGSEPPRSRA